MTRVEHVGNRVYIQRNILSVKKQIKQHGIWKGLAVANKVNSFHFEQGWHLGNRVEFRAAADVDEFVKNCLPYIDKELGNRVVFFDIKE
jgi:hypothetical protein